MGCMAERADTETRIAGWSWVLPSDAVITETSCEKREDTEAKQAGGSGNLRE